MKTENIPVTNNLKVTEIEWRASMGKYYAFVTAEDLGSQGKGFTPPHYKNYWGEADMKDESSILMVLRQGASWNNIP